MSGSARMAPSKRGDYSREVLDCPHCDTWAKLRSSRKVTRTVRDQYFQCQNLDCGHTFKVQQEIIATICPSARPRASVILPIRPSQLGQVAAAALPRPANDDAPVSAVAHA